MRVHYIEQVGMAHWKVRCPKHHCDDAQGIGLPGQPREISNIYYPASVADPPNCTYVQAAISKADQVLKCHFCAICLPRTSRISRCGRDLGA